MTAAPIAQVAGEGRATYENVYDYLLAHCIVEEFTLEFTLERVWAKAILMDALRVGGCAYWAGDRIARKMRWRYRDGRR